jgi:hypothetical protein
VVGLILSLTGAVWTLQGIGILKGSFMTGSAVWLWIGVACLVVGVPMALAGLRTRPSR